MLVNTQVTKATIYRHTARVNRNAAIELKKGHTILEFVGLPEDLDIDSVRVRAAGIPGAKLEGFSSKLTYHEKITRNEIQTMVEEVERLNQNLQAQESRIAAVDARTEHLDNLLKETRSFAFGLTNQKLSIAGHFETLEAISAEREKCLTQKSELQISLHNLQKQYNAKKKELERLSSQEQTATYQIDQPVSSEIDGVLQVEISYLQPECTWEPAYELSLHKGKLEVLYTANVSQQSGEDWQDVSLELSTSVPRTYDDLPELSPWYLQKFTPPVLREPDMLRMEMGQKSASPLMMASMAQLAVPPAAEYEDAEVSSAGTAAHYILPQKATLPSQNSSSRFIISKFTLDVEEDHLAIPRLSEEVFRRVKLVNTSNLVLLDGTAALYTEDAFIGKTQLPAIPRGAEYQLNFGVDERIEVRREMIRQAAAGKFLQDKRQRSYGYQIRISNPSDETIKLVLQDQLPVSKHEEIKVRLDRAEPNPDSKDDLNRMTWNLSLPPQSKKLVQFQFIVEAPSDMEIRGLPRD